MNNPSRNPEYISQVIEWKYAPLPKMGTFKPTRTESDEIAFTTYTNWYVGVKNDMKDCGMSWKMLYEHEVEEYKRLDFNKGGRNE